MKARIAPSTPLTTPFVAGLLLCGTLAAEGELLNPGFEDAVSANYWQTYSSDPAYKWVKTTTPINTPAAYNDGGCRVLEVGMYNAPQDATSGAYQVLPAREGQEFTFSGYALNPSVTCIANGYYAALLMIFLDSDGGVLAQRESDALRFDQRYDQWTPFTITWTAPAGSAEVGLYVRMVQTGAEPGGSTVWFDAMSATASPVPEPALTWGAALGLIVVAATLQARRRTCGA